ncbi:MAG: phospho-sugar mutase [Leptospiraceae bacterium]|nr:phospho-sugar mutase [Leptospiraceae bacterium]
MAGKTSKALTKEDLILSWTKAPFQANVIKEAQAIYEDFKAGKSDLEIEAYTIPLEFGTGGIRGIIGNGVGRMNNYTVGRAALGLCRHLQTLSKNPLIVIAYDSRRKSKEFAEVTAGIAASLKIRVKVFPAVAPTPLLSYAIRHFKAHGGVVITASHNPKEYNGFKAYLSDGGQLIPPDDGKIISAINNITDWNEITILKKTDPIYTKYVDLIEASLFETYKSKVLKSNIYNTKLDPKDRMANKIVYSPLHGTGGAYMKDLLKTAGYKNLFLVSEQEKPNGEFPTVKYPNPEEKEALQLCIETSKKRGANIFIATDPDADRLGIGIKKESGDFELLNGNQIGSIMCAYLSEKVAAAREKSKSKTEYHIFKTIVTSDLQESIAKANKIKIKNVLTGFKYIAEQMGKIDGDKTKKFLFGGEESYGYLPVEFVRDKDSLASALLLLEILSDKKDLLAYLDEIYLKYGLYLESLKSVTLKGEAGKQKILDSLEKLRTTNLLGQNLGTRKVISFMDYKNKKASGKATKAVFNGLPPADVIQLELEGNAKLTIRPSGTEPKVKLYSSFKSLEKPITREDLPDLREKLTKEIMQTQTNFIKLAGLDD